MLNLNTNAVLLNAIASDKEKAIRMCGELLQKNGYIKPDYIDSVLLREKMTDTYLGNGVAIPHGKLEDKNKIVKTGVVVIQFKDGVKWNNKNKAYLVVCIAAKTDEHMSILSKLTEIVQDKRIADKLIKTDDPRLIVKGLSTRVGFGAMYAHSKRRNLSRYPVKMELHINNPTGLHARPASKFVQVAKKFQSSIYVSHKGKVGNGKSLMSLLTLGVESGDLVQVMIKGEDERPAENAIRKAVMEGLEDVAEEAADKMEVKLPGMYRYSGKIFKGLSVSKGIVFAPVRLFKTDKIRIDNSFSSIGEEWELLKNSILKARKEIIHLYGILENNLGHNSSEIIRTQIDFIEDPELLGMAYLNIKEGKNAAIAWKEAIDNKIEEFLKMKSSFFASRQSDVKDVGARVLKIVSGSVDDQEKSYKEPVILLADELFPSDIAQIKKDYILGIATVKGGGNSHSAILTRAMGIPSMVGVDEGILSLAEGTKVVLDSNLGVLVVKPDTSDTALAESIRSKFHKMEQMEKSSLYDPAITKDGHRIEVLANVADTSEAAKVVYAGGEGIGLLRTEFLYINRKEPPSENDQYLYYRKIVEVLKGLPLTIRTLDIGGDKPVGYIKIPRENNPFLGVRGIRVSLRYRNIFEDQLKAVLRVSPGSNLRIMFPMITFVEEFEEAKNILDEIISDMQIPPVETGMMVEVPAAVEMIDKFSEKVDFFSIGTNDLTQYTLAIDRTHAELSKYAHSLHPSVLRMIDKTVKAAHKKNKRVGVCGDLAAYPDASIILVGLGIDEFSVNIKSIAAVKYQIRALNLKSAKKIAEKALDCETYEEVRALILQQR